MPYSAEKVDELYAQFESCAKRQNANKGSAVKRRAAEADLLKTTEKVRDLLQEAVKGDRDLLVAVFGGSCMRFHRFRQVKDTVELSDMYAGDDRWKDLVDAMDTIEEILKQLGTFKPFQQEAKVAPEISCYKGVRDRFTPGDRVLMRPECEGAEAESYTVSPELPAGLELNKSTGEIRGTMKPGAEVPPCKYTVTAKNAYGETQVDLEFSVGYPAPTGLSYSDVPSHCFTGEVVNFAPSVEGAAKEWSVSPALPPGLVLDPATGAISGMPTAPADTAEYTITASNVVGSTSATLSFGVKPAPPLSLHYAEAKDEFPFGSVLYLRPEVTLKTSAPMKRPLSANWDRVRKKVLSSSTKWQHVLDIARATPSGLAFTVEPPLPDGLVLSAKTGVISGKPTAPAEEATYRVTCRNAGGEIATDLKFGIKLNAPSELKYPSADGVHFLGEPITLSPDVKGNVAEWSVEPALPPGLQLDPSLGTISGVPTEVVPEGTWTVTARNADGETSAALTFAVQRAAPKGLAYPALSEDYPVLRPMAVQPTVEGKVDSFTVSPALPAGLALDPSTGVISGTPTEMAETATYTVTATNETGSATASLTFGVKVMPPEALGYPQVDDVYNVGEAVSLEPQVEGGATSWTVEPALPPGLVLDPSSGKISGAPTGLAEETSYVVTASNEAGGTSTVLTFSVTAPKPEGLSYPEASSEYTEGEPLSLEPRLKAGACATFSVEPALPEGLQLDPATGVISGSPVAEAEQATYTVSATNPSGSCSTELSFCISKGTQEETGVNQKFASMIEEITDIADMCEEPGKANNLGDWMIWMVHRAWLNDPSLTSFDFANKWMPPPHMEPRIAPKLMKALGHNTNIQIMQLANSNLMKPQGPMLAESLRKNTTLKILNIETNSLDCENLTLIAQALQENTNLGLEQLRFNNQKSLGSFFGRPVEEAFAQLMETNMRIVKLGFTVNDAHWRLKIDRAVLRNNDLARRRRKGQDAEEEEEVAAQDKPIAKLTLTTPLDKPAWEVFDPEDERATIVRAFMGENKRLPTKEQLQSFARSRGKAIPYSAVATVVKDFRAKLMNAVKDSKVSATDIYGVDYEGAFRAWTEKNERWSFDFWQGAKTRYNFQSEKQPIMELSSEFAAWLAPVD